MCRVGWGGSSSHLVWRPPLWFVATHVLFMVLFCVVSFVRGMWIRALGGESLDSFGARHSSSATREEEWVINNLEFVFKEFLFIVMDGVLEFIVFLATCSSSAFTLVGR